jgi:hypothetical protein
MMDLDPYASGKESNEMSIEGRDSDTVTLVESTSSLLSTGK